MSACAIIAAVAAAVGAAMAASLAGGCLKEGGGVGARMRGAWRTSDGHRGYLLAVLVAMALVMRAELRARRLEGQVAALAEQAAMVAEPARRSTAGRALMSVQVMGDSVQHTASAAGTDLSFSSDEDISFSAGGNEVATLSSTGELAVAGTLTVSGVAVTGSSYAVYQETTNQGSSSAGWNERALTNEAADPFGIGTVNGNGITLASGSYHVVGYAAWGHNSNSGGHFAIKVHTSSTTLAAGQSHYSTGGSHDTYGYVYIDDYITLGSSTTIYLSSYHERARDTYGMAPSCRGSAGVTCVFAQLRIEKLT